MLFMNGGVTSELYREMSDYARQRDTGITMHLAEVEADKIFLQEKYGLSPVYFVESVQEMATINGARALDLEYEIGSLEVGKKADFAIIDLNRLHTTPSPNPVSTLVYAAADGEVDTVVVDDQIVVDQGQLWNRKQ